MMAVLHDFGSTCVFFTKVFRNMMAHRFPRQAVFEQVASISLRSLPTIVFAGIFVGAILVLQFNLILSQYDAEIFLGGLNTSALIREVGPLFISFILAGKIGAYTAAELGTMRVTEQIDAIECLGKDPIQYLIVPRMVGIILSSILLLALGLLVSVTGSMVIAALLCDLNFLEFASSIPKFNSAGTLLGGMFKSLIYATVVAAVACHQGFHASGGARGVGRCVTLSAVYINFYIIFANYFTSQFIEFVGRFLNGVKESL